MFHEIKGRKYLLYQYLEVDGKWTINDTEMLKLWEMIKKHELEKQVFYTGEIKNFFDWLKLMQAENNIVHTIWDVTDGFGKEKIALIAWMNHQNKTSGAIHYMQFPAAWNNKVTKELGLISLDYLFSLRDDLLTLVGMTPTNLRTATLYLRRLGLEVIGTIPNMQFDFYKQKHVDVLISYATREVFYHGNT